MNELEKSTNGIGKLDELKLKAEIQNGPVVVPGQSVSGHDVLLHKRLDKGQKYFDSGDYQMARQKTYSWLKPPLKILKPINLFATDNKAATERKIQHEKQ